MNYGLTTNLQTTLEQSVLGKPLGSTVSPLLICTR